MVKRMKIFTTLALLLFVASPAFSDIGTYYIWDTWGGTWADAEKTMGNTEDDLMCWAAATSNILEYTGWGIVGGMTTTDDMFAHFQDHFTDVGGNSYFGFDWWFDGTNDRQGADWAALGWAQEDVDGGGGFYPTLDIFDYRQHTSTDSLALSSLDAWMHDGYGCTISISGGMAHAITAWGFTYDTTNPNYYTGIYVTDSDDDKTNLLGGYPDSLRYYSLSYENPAGSLPLAWYLNDFYGTYSTNYISEVCGLALAVVPVPAAVILGILGLGVVGVKLRKYA